MLRVALHGLGLAAVAIGLLSPPAACEVTSPILRYTSYAVFSLEDADIAPTLRSFAYGQLHEDYTYGDQPVYTVMDATGAHLDVYEAQIGSENILTVSQGAGPFGLIRAQPGNNYCHLIAASPHGYVATESAPLSVVNGFERLYFRVPEGLSGATLYAHAFSLNEAARIIVYNPQGEAVLEVEDSFVQPTAMHFAVPRGQDGKTWSVAMVEPEREDWVLDDCTIWMGPTLPGLLVPREEWVDGLSSLFAVEWRTLLDFEDGESNIATIQWDRAPGEGEQAPEADVRVTDEQAFHSTRSLRVEMRLPDPDQPNMLKLFSRNLEVGELQRVRFLLHGDGSGRRLKVRVRDASMEHHWAAPVRIDWNGWGEVTADFSRGGAVISGGDGNRQVDGPKISLVVQIGHEPGQPEHSVYYIDDVMISP